MFFIVIIIIIYILPEQCIKMSRVKHSLTALKGLCHGYET